ncbi:hypothetical protein AMECASPLE_018297, partial [Ameca splendens]
AVEALLGYLVLVENLGHRANLEKKALMACPVLMAKRASQVTLAHQDKTALRDQRESKGQEVCQVWQEQLDFRVMRDQLGQLDLLEPR